MNRINNIIRSRIDQLLAIWPDDTKLHVTLAGAGGSLGMLLAVPGISRVLARVNMLYDNSEVLRAVGMSGENVKLVSRDIAIGLACGAIEEADHTRNIISVGATSAITSNRYRRGDNQIWVHIKNSGNNCERPAITENCQFPKMPQDEHERASDEHVRFYRETQDMEVSAFILDKLIEFIEKNK